MFDFQCFVFLLGVCLSMLKHPRSSVLEEGVLNIQKG